MNSIIAGMRGGREGAREVAGQISRPCASGRETAAASPLLGVLSFGGDEEGEPGRWMRTAQQQQGVAPWAVAAAV